MLWRSCCTVALAGACIAVDALRTGTRSGGGSTLAPEPGAGARSFRTTGSDAEADSSSPSATSASGGIGLRSRLASVVGAAKGRLYPRSMIDTVVGYSFNRLPNSLKLESLQRLASAASSSVPPPLTRIDVPFKEQEKQGTGPYDWLEEKRVPGSKVDEWVTAQSERARNAILKDGRKIEDTQLYKERLTLLEEPDFYARSMYGTYVEGDGYIYDFEFGEDNPRGLWRRTTLDELKKEKPAWEVLLNLDEFNKKSALASRCEQNRTVICKCGSRSLKWSVMLDVALRKTAFSLAFGAACG